MATKQLRFSKRVIEAFKPPIGADREWIRDSGSPGLWLAVFATGARVFYRYSKVGGRPERIRIGRFPELSVEQARRENLRLAGRIAAGANPNEERRAARRVPTFGEMLASYIAAPRRGRVKRERRPSTIRAYQSLANTVFAPWSSRPISSITRAHVETLVDQVARERGKGAAKNSLDMARAVFIAAVNAEIIPSNPARLVVGFATVERERFLTVDELGRLMKALDGADESLRDLVRLALYTAARRSNLCHMRADELDLPGATWSIPGAKMKNGKAHVLPLSAAAVDILRRRLAIGSEWIFPGKNGRSAPFPTVRWQALLKAANISGFVFHDLRRTAATLATTAGAPLPIVSRLLGHATLAQTSVYARPADEATRAAVDQVASKIAAAIEGKTP